MAAGKPRGAFAPRTQPVRPRLPFRQVGVLLVLSVLSVGVEPTRHGGAAT